MKTINQRTYITMALIVAVILLAGCTLQIDPENERVQAMDETIQTESGYIDVNGLHMYYEIHGENQGEGQPLVLLHGGLTDIKTSFGTVIPMLAKSRQIIAVEQQAHGHTADIDRPLTFEQMADDTAALLRQIGVEKADFFGYSDGGNVAIAIAIRHPDLVRKVAVAGTNFNNEGLQPGLVEFFESATAEDLGPEMRDLYASVAPNPDDWPTLVEKVMQQALAFEGWSPEQLQTINAPVLFVIGDADIVRPEHAVEMVHLLPYANLAVLPNTDHFMRLQSPEWLLSMLTDFSDAPMPETQ
jgi:pimeloyl-ACP methyl ester carboxylesterase